MQCMYARGNQIPGRVAIAGRRRRALSAAGLSAVRASSGYPPPGGNPPPNYPPPHTAQYAGA